MLDKNMQIYAWDDNPESLLLIEWKSNGNKISFDCFGDDKPTPYPHVVNGHFNMAQGVEKNKIFLNRGYDTIWASYVCQCPDYDEGNEDDEDSGDGYNEILDKARMQGLLFTPQEVA